MSTLSSAVPATREWVTIGDMLTRPGTYYNRMVVIEGRFRGWHGSCPASFKRTRSDWLLEDDTGCIYVTGILPPGLSAAMPKGEQAMVVGMPMVNKDGKVLVEAKQVIAGPTRSRAE